MEKEKLLRAGYYRKLIALQPVVGGMQKEVSTASSELAKLSVESMCVLI